MSSDEETGIDLDEIMTIPDHFSDISHTDVEERAALLKERLLKSGAQFSDDLIAVTALSSVLQEQETPSFERSGILYYAAAHDVAKGDINRLKQEITAYAEDARPIKTFCQISDSDFRLYEMDIEHPSDDFREQTSGAMEEDDTGRACAYGMMAAENALRLMALFAIGRGAQVAGQAVLTALGYQISAENVIDSDVLEAVKSNAATDQFGDQPLRLLNTFGGYDIAALVGAILAGRLAGAVVFVEGYAGLAAAAVVSAMDSGAIDHVVYAGGELEFPSLPLRALASNSSVVLPLGHRGAAEILYLKQLEPFLQTPTGGNVVNIKNKAKS